MAETDWAPTPWRDASGKRIVLELVWRRPPGEGPFPTIIFNHGSTGDGRDPARFRVTWVAEELAGWLVRKGWQVVFPQRRGRGRSGGTYEEGLEPDRRAYSCRVETAAAGLDHALADLDAAATHVVARPEVDRGRLVVGGFSRGGLLSLVYAAMHPFAFRGVLNFAGGWLGRSCPSADLVNATLSVRGAAFPGETAWFYAEGDSFYPLAHCANNFRPFRAAGGRGELHVVPALPGSPAHQIHKHPPAWDETVSAFLQRAAPATHACH